MEWNNETGMPVAGTYKVKDPALEKLLLAGWHKEGPRGRNAEGILPYAVSSGKAGDEVMASHYRDILDGHLRMRTSWPDMQDTLCRLYFCDREEDIWDMLKEGLGDIDSFIRTYSGYSAGQTGRGPGLTASEERLEKFCRYMEKDNPDLRARVDFIRDISALLSPGDFYIGRADFR